MSKDNNQSKSGVVVHPDNYDWYEEEEQTNQSRDDSKS